MAPDSKGWHERGYLPHFDTAERPQHIVFRTSGSLPASAVASLPSEPVARVRAVEGALDRLLGSCPLSDADTAALAETALLHFHGKRYDLLAWCVMPNHVHAVAAWRLGWSMGDTIRSWKAFSASRINRVKGSTGPFWARDYFDRVIRNEDDLQRTVAYVEDNPVRAGLVATAQAWRYSSAARKERA